jgi:hypothetical protein
MISQYAANDFEESLAFAIACASQVVTNVQDVCRVTGCEFALDVSNRFIKSKPMPRVFGILPSQDEATIRSSEATAKNIV